MKNFAVSNPAISWIERFLREQVHQDIILSFSKAKKIWVISLPQTETRITTAFIPSLYQLGIQEQLEYTKTQASSPLFDSESTSLSAPGLSKTGEALVRETSSGLHIQYDICGLIYWMLCRCEEINAPKHALDTHGRFSSANSHAHKNNYLERPIVDEWIALLRKCIVYSWPNCQLVAQEFRLIISHDIDHISKYHDTSLKTFIRSLASDVIKRKKYGELLRAPVSRLIKSKRSYAVDPFNTFEWIMNESEQRGTLSSFFFMCDATNPQYDTSTLR